MRTDMVVLVVIEKKEQKLNFYFQNKKVVKFEFIDINCFSLKYKSSNITIS